MRSLGPPVVGPRGGTDFESGRTRSADWRRRQLDGLLDLLANEEQAIQAALEADLGKSAFEAWLTDVGPCVAEVRHAKDYLEQWMKPRSVSSPLVVQPARSAVQPEPLATVLIIAPWNYPLQLVVNPLAGVLAAGNTAVVKPSELAPATSAVLAEMLPRYVDGVHVVEGAVPETTELLALPFDHILFTGSTEVGRIVMRAAADNFVPVTLELGGKSPVVVDETVDLPTAARRIMWGMLLNAGQTCIAPDYCLVDRLVVDRFVAELAEAVTAFHGADPRQSGDLARIVNGRHHFCRSQCPTSPSAASDRRVWVATTAPRNGWCGQRFPADGRPANAWPPGWGVSPR